MNGNYAPRLSQKDPFSLLLARFEVRQLHWVMPLISLSKKIAPSLKVAKGSNLMKSLLEAGLPVASSCDGDGVCAKCRIQIVEGAENLSSENDVEVF